MIKFILDTGHTLNIWLIGDSLGECDLRKYGHGASDEGNKSPKCRYQLDMNPKPGGLQHSAITITTSECSHLAKWRLLVKLYYQMKHPTNTGNARLRPLTERIPMQCALNYAMGMPLKLLETKFKQSNQHNYDTLATSLVTIVLLSYKPDTAILQFFIIF